MEKQAQAFNGEFTENVYLHQKELLRQVKHKSFLRLDLPSELENRFVDEFSEKSRQRVIHSTAFVLLPFLLMFLLISWYVPGQELMKIFGQTILNTFTGKVLFKGITGVIQINVMLTFLLFALWYLSKTAFFTRHTQSSLAAICSIMLGLMMVCLTLVDDERFLLTTEIELIFFYLLCFCLLYMQTLYCAITIALSSVLFLLIVSAFTINPDWPRFLTIYFGFGLFSIIFSHIRENQARQSFLNMFTILTEKKYLELLNQTTENENRLKAELAEFYSVMSGEKNIFKLAEKIIGYLVPHMKASAASLYYVKDNQLELLAKYGLAKEYAIKENMPVEGSLLAQAIFQKQHITIEKAPDDFHILQSGLGKIQSPALTIAPLLFDDEVVAVMEFASIKPLEKNRIAFLHAANRSVSTAIKAVYAQYNKK